MSWLLFLDESGHDHKHMPYEVRGGIAVHASKLWPFVRDLRRLEVTSFGTELAPFRKEFKGSELLDKDRYKWAAQAEPLPDDARRKHCRAFFTNWGFRLPGIGMNAPVRRDIADEFGPWLHELQFHGQGYRDGDVFDSYGIVYVTNPYD